MRSAPPLPNEAELRAADAVDDARVAAAEEDAENAAEEILVIHQPDGSYASRFHWEPIRLPHLPGYEECSLCGLDCPQDDGKFVLC